MSVIRVVLADDHAVDRQGIQDSLDGGRDIEVVAEAPDGETSKATQRALLLRCRYLLSIG